MTENARFPFDEDEFFARNLPYLTKAGEQEDTPEVIDQEDITGSKGRLTNFGVTYAEADILAGHYLGKLEALNEKLRCGAKPGAREIAVTLYVGIRLSQLRECGALTKERVEEWLAWATESMEQSRGMANFSAADMRESS